MRLFPRGDQASFGKRSEPCLPRSSAYQLFAFGNSVPKGANSHRASMHAITRSTVVYMAPDELIMLTAGSNCSWEGKVSCANGVYHLSGTALISKYLFSTQSRERNFYHESANNTLSRHRIKGQECELKEKFRGCSHHKS